MRIISAMAIALLVASVTATGAAGQETSTETETSKAVQGVADAREALKNVLENLKSEREAAQAERQEALDHLRSLRESSAAPQTGEGSEAGSNESVRAAATEFREKRARHAGLGIAIEAVQAEMKKLGKS